MTMVSKRFFLKGRLGYVELPAAGGLRFSRDRVGGWSTRKGAQRLLDEDRGLLQGYQVVEEEVDDGLVPPPGPIESLLRSPSSLAARELDEELAHPRVVAAARARSVKNFAREAADNWDAALDLRERLARFDPAAAREWTLLCDRNWGDEAGAAASRDPLYDYERILGLERVRRGPPWTPEEFDALRSASVPSS